MQKSEVIQSYVSRETGSANLVAPMALTKPDHSTPNAVWSDTETELTIKIKLTGVTEYGIYITRNKLFLFDTWLNDTFYKLNVTLFGKVDSKPEHEAKGFYVNIKLKKQVPGKWERLISGKQKMRNISYDPEVLELEEKPKEEKVHIPFLFDEKDKPKFVYEYGSDVDYEESDANSYDSDD